MHADRKKQKPQTANISDWSKLGPGGGGATFFPTFSYKTEEEFLVRCDMTGSYLTKDGGESYHQINFPNGANSFAFDPHDTTTIYIGSSSLNRSTDGGKTWEQIFPVNEEIVSEKYEGDHANYSFKTVSTSLYNSERGDVNRIKVDPVKKDMLYFSMGKAFYYSNDRGRTFNRKDLQHPVDFVYKPISLKDEVLIFTANSIYTFNKSSNAVVEKALPAAMAPAFSFTGGTVKDSEQVILYALHHDQSKTIEEAN